MGQFWLWKSIQSWISTRKKCSIKYFFSNIRYQYYSNITGNFCTNGEMRRKKLDEKNEDILGNENFPRENKLTQISHQRRWKNRKEERAKLRACWEENWNLITKLKEEGLHASCALTTLKKAYVANVSITNRRLASTWVWLSSGKRINFKHENGNNSLPKKSNWAERQKNRSSYVREMRLRRRDTFFVEGSKLLSLFSAVSGVRAINHERYIGKRIFPGKKERLLRSESRNRDRTQTLQKYSQCVIG